MNTPLEDIASLAPNIIFDLRYQTANNVVGHAIAETAPAQLQARAARKLALAAAEIQQKGYVLVVWDAYRNLESQRQLLKINRDQHYVLTHSNHLKGLAVDVTLATPDGRQLDMGSGFDDFSERSNADFENLTGQQLGNRKVLRAAMEAAGFTVWLYEWWHFDDAQV